MITILFSIKTSIVENVD